MFNKLIKAVILIAVFITPLFYLPITQDMFSFNKEILFLILMLIAGVLWFGKAVQNKKLEVIRSPLDVPILLILLIYGLATITSIDWLESLLNMNGVGLPSFLAMLSLTLFYFICVNVFVDKKSLATVDTDTPKKATKGISLIFTAVLASSFVAQIIAYLSYFQVYFLPNQHSSFNTIGSSSGFAFFVAITLPLALFFLLRKPPKQKQGEKATLMQKLLPKAITSFTVAYIIISLFTLNTINFIMGWAVVIIGVFVFLVLFTTYYNQISVRVNLAWIGALVLALGLVSIVLRPASIVSTFAPDNLKPQIPAEVSLSRQVSFDIAAKSSIKSPINFLFGSGPANFAYNFSDERPVEFNNNPLWRVRFNRAGNMLAETIATVGWLGLVSFLVLFVFFLATAGFLLFKMKDIKNNYTFLLITLISSFIGVLSGFWFRVPQISVFLFVWLIFAITAIVSIRQAPEKFTTVEFNFKGSTKSALSLSFSLVFVFVLLLFFVVYMARLYLGEWNYKKSLELSTEVTEENLILANNRAVKAINLNPRRAEYYLHIARVNLTQAQMELNKAEGEIDGNRLKFLLASPVNYSKTALDLKPKSVDLWENRGLIFELVSPFAETAREFAVQSYKRASELEPTNPVLYYRLGENQRLLWLKRKAAKDAASTKEKEAADDFDLNLLDEAIANLEKSIELKPDYYIPYLSLSRISEEQGDINSSITYLSTALSFEANQNNAAAYYELSRLLYNKLLQGEEEIKANNPVLVQIKLLLDNAVILSPDYANALYTRALVLRQLGTIDAAIADMEKVLKLNPKNVEAKAKLEELKRLNKVVAPEPKPITLHEEDLQP